MAKHFTLPDDSLEELTVKAIEGIIENGRKDNRLRLSDYNHQRACTSICKPRPFDPSSTWSTFGISKLVNEASKYPIRNRRFLEYQEVR